VYSAEDLAAVAAELNARPPRTLGWDTPAARLLPLAVGVERSLAVAAEPERVAVQVTALPGRA
jgi:predicted component of type VI protein secretion system